MADQVVHILRLPEGVTREQVVYIGRADRWRKLPASIFANPFKISSTLTREEAIARYAQEVATQPEIQAALRALTLEEDVIFACWCSPIPCHGDVLVRLREQWRDEEVA